MSIKKKLNFEIKFSLGTLLLLLGNGGGYIGKSLKHKVYNNVLKAL
jgi:hypothetical protein